jgi:hypothetical protein
MKRITTGVRLHLVRGRDYFFVGQVTTAFSSQATSGRSGYSDQYAKCGGSQKATPHPLGGAVSELPDLRRSYRSRETFFAAIMYFLKATSAALADVIIRESGEFSGEEKQCSSVTVRRCRIPPRGAGAPFPQV